LHEIQKKIGSPGGMKLASDKDWKKDKDVGDKGEKLWIEWFEKFHTVFECKLFNAKKSQTTKHIDGVIVVNFRYNSSLIEIKSRTFNYFKEYSNDGLILLEVNIIDGEVTDELRKRTYPFFDSLVFSLKAPK